MTEFIIKAETTITTQHSVYADTLDEAIEVVEDQQFDEFGEEVVLANSGLTATEYAMNGQMGWLPVPSDEET